jgi:hypothetical protein
MRKHYSQYWRHKTSGEIWAVGHSKDPDRGKYEVIHVAVGPLHHNEIDEESLWAQVHNCEFEGEDAAWMEEHKGEFVVHELARDDGSNFTGYLS